MKKRTIFGLAVVGAVVGAGIYAVKKFLENTEITIEEEIEIDDLDDDEEDLDDEDDFCECDGKCKCHKEEDTENEIPGQMTLNVEETIEVEHKCDCEDKKVEEVHVDETVDQPVGTNNEDEVVIEETLEEAPLAEEEKVEFTEDCVQKTGRENRKKKTN